MDAWMHGRIHGNGYNGGRTLRRELMGKLVTVIGNCGSGKTTLTKMICERLGSTTAMELLEQHAERPFQKRFMEDLSRDAFQNQVDYLLLRVEQERSIRAGGLDRIGVQDGGLDQDFFVFSHLFLRKGYLRQEEFDLIERLHTLWRELLPAADGIIRLKAPLPVLAARRAQRQRAIDIVQEGDLPVIEGLVERWMRGLPPGTALLEVETGEEHVPFEQSMGEILEFVGQR
jgi:deoxyadenosine/deoxycytidine kinase